MAGAAKEEARAAQGGYALTYVAKRENWFGFGCRLALVGWCVYRASLLFEALELVRPGFKLSLQLAASGVANETSTPLRIIWAIIVFQGSKWAAVAGCILAARWALGFSDWPMLGRTKTAPPL